jgi:hypothetical protein
MRASILNIGCKLLGTQVTPWCANLRYCASVSQHHVWGEILNKIGQNLNFMSPTGLHVV